MAEADWFGPVIGGQTNGWWPASDLSYEPGKLSVRVP